MAIVEYKQKEIEEILKEYLSDEYGKVFDYENVEITWKFNMSDPKNVSVSILAYPERNHKKNADEK